MHEVYLDNNSTTKLLPEVCEAVIAAAQGDASNPSSSQPSGDRARAVLRDSRAALAELIGCDPGSLYFTSGGTEANSWVLQALARREVATANRILTSPIEHASILRTCDALADIGVTVDLLPADVCGRVNVVDLAASLQRPTTLVSIQWANNETGVVQPIQAIAEECRRRGVLFHTDAAQAVGKLPIDLHELPADFLTLTAHKWHGPAGVGALYVRSPRRFGPLFFGGGQEAGLRPGTENILGIAGMGCAARLRSARLAEVSAAMQRLRDEFEQQLLQRIPSAVINGGGADRICNTSNVLFAGIDGEAMVAQLGLEGISCSQGSACESMRPEPSRVLRAMGLSEEDAYASIRFSFSELNSNLDVDVAVETIGRVHELIAARSRSLARQRSEV